MAKRIVVTGGNGQLGQTIARLSQNPGRFSDLSVQPLDSSQLDITDTGSLSSVLGDLQPDVIINAAAYTQVDKAESDEEQAHLVNATGVANIARWSGAHGTRVIHISTDFVFDGKSTRPYTERDPAGPLGAYGRSKLAGEQQLQTILPRDSAVVRTSWLYSEYGSNFVKTMLRLMAEREQLGVVSDQIGSPTSTSSAALLLLTMAQNEFQHGLFHWTDGGAISWYDFACQIQREAINQGLLKSAIPVQAISTEQYPTPARRPAYSVLDRSRTLARFACPETRWKEELTKVIGSLASPEQLQ